MKYEKAKLKTGIVALCVVVALPLLFMNSLAEFNNSGVTVRAAGMGQAFSAVSDDAGAISANPAGLALLSHPEFIASYGKLYPGLSDNSKLGQSAIGLALPVAGYLSGVSAFAWDELRLSEAYSETSFTVSCATAVVKHIYAGLNLKYLRKSYTADDYTASDPVFSGHGYAKGAFAADLGGLYQFNSRLNFALVMKNINQPDLGLGGKSRLPAEFRSGAAYKFNSGTADAELAFRGRDYDVLVGAERGFQGKYFLRLGLAAGSGARRTFSAGLGVRMGSLGFDYAFILPLTGLASSGGQHRLGFGFKFGDEGVKPDPEADLKVAQKKLTEQEEKIQQLEKTHEAALAREKAAREQAPVKNEQNARIEKREPVKAVKENRPKSYIAGKDDTLESIAAQIYGDADKWELIYKANAEVLGRGGAVRPGQELVIP